MNRTHAEPALFRMKRADSINFLIMVCLLCTSFSFWGCKTQTTENSNSEPISTFQDVDGTVYQVKKVGKKYWMLENFKARRNQSGQPLQGVYSYNDDDSHTNLYGRLYTWNAAVEATPAGWHLPTEEDWAELFALAGGPGVAGGNLKATGTIRWNEPNSGATNTMGLSLVGGGFRGPDGTSYDFGKHGSYWGTANLAQDPYCVYLYSNSAQVLSEVSPIDKTSGIAFAVRYVK